MSKALRVALLCLGLTLLAAVRPAHAQNGGPPRLDGPRPVMAGEIPPQLDAIGIEDKAGALLPRDVRLTGSDGRSFILGEYLDGERPLVLVLAYYGCPMLCSMVLNGTQAALDKIDQVPGKDYRFLVVSFDPKDQVDVAHGKRASYVDSMARKPLAIDGSDLAAYEFAVGDEAEVRRLSDAVGFRYRWDEEQKQYAHAAGIFVVTPGGKLSTVLTGIAFPPEDVSEAVKGAGQGVSHSPLKSVLLYCFQYNPVTGKYVLAAGRAMRIGAAVSLAVLSFLLYRLVRAERRARSTPDRDKVRQS